MTRSNWRSVVSSIDVRVSMPALLTMMSRRPNAATVLSTRRLQVGDRRHVALDRLRLAPGGLDLLDRRFGGLLVLVVVDRDRGSLPAQLEADRVADPAVTTGDDGGLVLQRHLVPPQDIDGYASGCAGCGSRHDGERQQTHDKRDDRHGPVDQRQAQPDVLLQRTDPERGEPIPHLVEGDQQPGE